MERSFPARVSEPRRWPSLQLPPQKLLSQRPKAGALGSHLGSVPYAMWVLGKCVPSVGLSFLARERSCLGSTTLWTWGPQKPVGQDNRRSAVQMWAGQVVPDSLP